MIYNEMERCCYLSVSFVLIVNCLFFSLFVCLLCCFVLSLLGGNCHFARLIFFFLNKMFKYF